MALDGAVGGITLGERRILRRSVLIVAGAVLAVAVCFGLLVHAYANLRAERVDFTRIQAVKLRASFEQHALRLFDYADGRLLTARHIFTEQGEAGLRRFLTAVGGHSDELLITSITIIGPDGHVIFHHPDTGIGTDLSGRSEFGHFQADPSDRPYVGEARRGVISGEVTFRMARPILRDGRLAGAIQISIRPEYLSDFFGDLELGPHGAATMLNTDRRLIARLPVTDEGEYGKVLGRLRVWTELERGPSGSFYTPTGIDGIGRTFFFKKLDAYPVVINVGYSDQDIDASLADARRNLMLVGALWALVTVVVCLLLLRMERKTQELALANGASTRAAADLEAVNAMLKQSNADLEEFAYVASHDLQSPLRNVVSYAQLLDRRFRGQLGSDGDEFIGFIVGNASRMSVLIRDLLDYARVSKQPQEVLPVACERALAIALADLEQSIKDSGAKITVQPLPVVLADEAQLASLFQNLVGNAIKFRHPDQVPEITIAAQQVEANWWRFQVADNGIGIEPEYQEKIFSIFQRLHTSDQYEGSGIGLALCRRIVNRFGGTIWVESSLGQGTSFFFTLRDGTASP